MESKSYSFGRDVKDEDEESLPLVNLPKVKEEKIIHLIREHKRTAKVSKSVSLRLSSKKLTSLYDSLKEIGFNSNQIEQSMENTIHLGGDLTDALDWLCLNINDDEFPSGLSQVLCIEENKTRLKFVPKPEQPPVTPSVKASASYVDKKEKEPSEVNLKKWIMDYAQDLEDSEENAPGVTEEIEKSDPNELYLENVAKLLDLKKQALQLKFDGDSSKQKFISRQIADLMREICEIEKREGFNPSNKMSVEEDQTAVKKEPKEVLEDEPLGLGFFEEQSSAESSKPSKSVEASKLDQRSFEYTRQQWTGKSPKQFLIDWIRKNLPKSPPPKFEKVTVNSYLFRSRCKVQTKTDVISVMPEIVCGNFKEAEHLASTLALFNLCKGTRVYQLLPPVYRAVWLEWQESEDKSKDDAKSEENKPRDKFIQKLLKTIKNLKTESSETESKSLEEATVEESWENIEDDWSTEANEVDKEQDRPVVDSNKLRRIFESRRSSDSYQRLLASRKSLPVYQQRDAVLSKIRNESVVVIAGETGSGKSTQIPQFILEDFLLNGKADKCNIVCTQPRRISAVSLARRVSEELGESGPGHRNSFCGYQIRFETKRSEATHLLYCTTGVLLRKLMSDPLLSDLTHVIVDEVHERNVDSDFLLIVLKRILEKRRDFKVVLMSATLDSDKFSRFFQCCKVVHIPGKLFPVNVFHLEDIIEKIGYVLDVDSPYALPSHLLVEENKTTLSVSGKGRNKQKTSVVWSKEDLYSLDRSELDTEKYSLRTRNALTRLNQKRINMELIMELLTSLNQDPKLSSIQGAVLIFLPGLSHIHELHDMLQSDRNFSNDNKYLIIALHSTLSSDDQSKAFITPPNHIRKIVLATNIAETGITIPDVVFVIDTGKVKETRYLEGSQMSTLEEVFISKASAKQRQGRAGRLQRGLCFRLYSTARHASFKSFTVPEILRVPLEGLCLQIMKGEHGDPVDFLTQALDPPQSQSIVKAMRILREVGACSPSAADLTPLGHHLALLPVNVRIGKMLIYGAMFGCLEPLSLIAASMMDKSPFSAPLNRREELDSARQAFAAFNSDHLTVYKAFLGWKLAQKKGFKSERSFCDKNFLKKSALIEIENVSNDLMKLIRTIGFTKNEKGLSTVTSASDSKLTQQNSGEVLNIKDSQQNSCENSLSASAVAVIKASIVAGLYPQVAQTVYKERVDQAANPDKELCNANTESGLVQAHPTSVNRHLCANGWLVYHEKLKSPSGPVYLRDSSLVTPLPLLLFGGPISVFHREKRLVIDNWIKFKAYARTAVIFKELRLLVNNLLQSKVENPKINLQDDPAIKIILDLITSENITQKV